MDETSNLKLPYLIAAQAQKHVTHNEALDALDAIVQLAVLDRNLSAPGASPSEGDRYIVAANPTGAWAGQQGKIAAYQNVAWSFYQPREGWLVWVADEDALLAYNGSAWVATATEINPAAKVGINTTADTTNRLSVSSPATLFSHEGAGHQLKINKAAAAQTGSVLFQTAFSGRAEFGTTGDDDFHVKVSPDGGTWKDALVINRSTGAVTMPFTGAAQVSFAPAGNIAATTVQAALQELDTEKIGGTAGTVDNRLVRSDGTGGKTLQTTNIAVDDSDAISGFTNLKGSSSLAYLPSVLLASTAADVSAPVWNSEKYRGGSTPAQANDFLGLFAFRSTGYTGVVNNAVLISAVSAGPTGVSPTGTGHAGLLTVTTVDTSGASGERLRLSSSGDLGIATNAPSQRLDVNDDSIRIRSSQTPATAAASGRQGEIAWDNSYVYVCVATNTWKRSAIATW